MKASAFLCLQLLLLSPGNVLVGAQPSSPASNDNMYPGYARFNPSMTIIIVILIASLFFLTFFALYIRHCFDSSGAAGSVRRALSMRYHWTSGSRGLDPSVIENFPVFSYAEVKAHKIGKEALECAVCLNEFGEDETLRLLPKCDHVFHPECIGAWLRSNVTCPVCRANLAPQPADEPVTGPGNDNLECGDSSNEETVIHVCGDQSQGQEAPTNRDSSLPKGPERSWSTGKPKVFDLAKFRSHSTGHSLVQPGENLERFTLRLPEEIRKEVMERAAANRSRSRGTTLAREESSRRWCRTEAGEGSSRAGWFSRRIDGSDRQSKSDRWVSVARGFSMMRSTKVVAPAETGDSGGPSTTTPSFSDDPSRHPDLV